MLRQLNKLMVQIAQILMDIFLNHSIKIHVFRKDLVNSWISETSHSGTAQYYLSPHKLSKIMLFLSIEVHEHLICDLLGLDRIENLFDQVFQSPFNRPISSIQKRIKFINYQSLNTSQINFLLLPILLQPIQSRNQNVYSIIQHLPRLLLLFARVKSPYFKRNSMFEHPILIFHLYSQLSIRNHDQSSRPMLLSKSFPSVQLLLLEVLEYRSCVGDCFACACLGSYDARMAF